MHASTVLTRHNVPTGYVYVFNWLRLRFQLAAVTVFTLPIIVAIVYVSGVYVNGVYVDSVDGYGYKNHLLTVRSSQKRFLNNNA